MEYELDILFFTRNEDKINNFLKERALEGWILVSVVYVEAMLHYYWKRKKVS